MKKFVFIIGITMIFIVLFVMFFFESVPLQPIIVDTVTVTISSVKRDIIVEDGYFNGDLFITTGRHLKIQVETFVDFGDYVQKYIHIPQLYEYNYDINKKNSDMKIVQTEVIRSKYNGGYEMYKFSNGYVTGNEKYQLREIWVGSGIPHRNKFIFSYIFKEK
jgi:hypothetical protein